MALLQWLRKPEATEEPRVTNYPSPILPTLPDPNEVDCPISAKRIAASNNKVTLDFCEKLVVKPRGSNNYSEYSDDFRTKVARFAIANSNKKASLKFNVPVTTAKTWRSQLLKKVQFQGPGFDVTTATIVSQSKDRPTELPTDYDEAVIHNLRKMQSVLEKNYALFTKNIQKNFDHI